MNKHDRLLYLFDRLSDGQQNDILNLLETWTAMPSADEGDNTALNPALTESIGREWHCLNALKKVVSTHFPPRLELAYLAFHPDLDSYSTAKSRAAAEKMYTLEAAYELKRIFESEPESEVFTGDVAEMLQKLLYEEGK